MERQQGDLRPEDLFLSYQRTKRRLWHLTCKHFLLRRVRALCHYHQRKWTLAGPLAYLDSPGLRDVLSALVDRHLAVREADGSFSIHPAVRDHFHRLAAMTQEGSWHDVLREQFVSLIQQPGLRLPHDPTTLDLLEEAIYHALQAGRTDQAEWLYRDVLGGLRHLGWKLGEMARGLRILRGFDPCPDTSGMAWFLRALGELEQAHALHLMAHFRGDIRLLQGRLPEVAAEGNDARTAAAGFLMGHRMSLPPDLLGCAVPRDQLLLYLGRPDLVRRGAPLEGLYQNFGWEGDRARCHLLLAEAARRQNDLSASRKHLDAATPWILRSGSVEHLCLLHLFQARAAKDENARLGAARAIDEGLHLARRCGLRLYQVELLCAQSELLLANADPGAAETAAREAVRLAAARDCRFYWGAIAARELLGRSLAAQKKLEAARAVLRKTLRLRERRGDSEAVHTERLLQQLNEPEH